MQTTGFGLLFACVAMAACPAHGAGLSADPLHAYRTMLDEVGKGSGKTVLSRYVVRDGRLRDFASVRKAVIQTQHLCAESKGAAKVSATDFPEHLGVLRDEEYLSERVILKVQSQASLHVDMADCSLAWRTTRTGSLSFAGIGVCLLDFDKKQATGHCGETGAARHVPVPASLPPASALASAPVRQFDNGIACRVVPNLLGGDLTKDGHICVWVPDASEKQRLPGLLGNPLVLAVDFGNDNGSGTATAIGNGTPVNASLFSLPPGFRREAR